jgi:hypothetical protein
MLTSIKADFMERSPKVFKASDVPAPRRELFRCLKVGPINVSFPQYPGSQIGDIIELDGADARSQLGRQPPVILLCKGEKSPFPE